MIGEMTILITDYDYVSRIKTMGNLTTKEIIEATGGRVIYGNPNNGVFTGVSIDSRTIREGELFVALKGQRFDGHNFLFDALQIGSGAVVSVPPAEPPKGRIIVYVNNTLKALQDMAHYVRMKAGITVIGVTGTNGKTTTKEMIASILGMKHRVMKSSGNLNNHIGVPLSLMGLNEGDEFGVMEMGASIKGDIRQLCEIAQPDYGVITNVGPGHLEGFGSLDVVRDTKLELMDAVKTIALNADDDFLMEGIVNRAQRNILTYGIVDDSSVQQAHDVYARDIELRDRYSEFKLCLKDGGWIGVRVNVPGRFNIYNALAAASICSALGAGLSDIKNGIESFTGIPMRLEFKELSGAAVISDVYNANPASMEEAVKELVRQRKGRAIAVLGDMLELGSYAEEAHRKLGRWMSGLAVDILIAVGPMMSKAAEEFSVKGRQSIIVSDPHEAREVLLEMCNMGDTVLIKGSRGMKMEAVLECPVRIREGVGDAL
ncbi:MAG: UDP-N-acetylmuramoyl-tripeptide--D-alanyl-D-alanine ligase [Thermodesulfovibrionales bacterium]